MFLTTLHFGYLFFRVLGVKNTCGVQSVSIHDNAEETGSGYGMEVAMLQKASELLVQAFRHAQR